MRTSITFIAFVSLTTLAALGAGCTSPAGNPAGDGSLELPLTQTGADGALYHLANATFEITGPSGVPLVVDGSGAADSVSVSVAPGVTSVALNPGWTLQRSTDGGATYQPIGAVLASPNPAGLRVLANHADTVSFQFLVRNPDGSLTITFGVTTHPRELAGGIIVSDATGDYAPYVDPSTPKSNRADFAIYYDGSLDQHPLADGTKQNTFTTDTVAMEIANDAVGLLTNPIAIDFTAGHLAYDVTAQADGSLVVQGEYDSFDGSSVLTFGPNTVDAPPSPSTDAAGYPADVFFYDSTLPFTLTTQFSDGEATMTGQLRMRFIP